MNRKTTKSTPNPPVRSALRLLVFFSPWLTPGSGLVGFSRPLLVRRILFAFLLLFSVGCASFLSVVLTLLEENTEAVRRVAQWPVAGHQSAEHLPPLYLFLPSLSLACYRFLLTCSGFRAKGRDILSIRTQTGSGKESECRSGQTREE